MRCSVDGCNDKHAYKGFCLKHYTRNRRYGTTDLLQFPGGTLEDRLKHDGWIVTESQCWEFSGGRSAGYGIVNWEGAPQRTHRLAYMTWVGPIPEGHVVRHKCDNPPCINPDHLETGTCRENSQDMVKRGRAGSFKTRRLSPEEVQDIRDTYSSGLLSTEKWGELYGVSGSCVVRILAGQTYRDHSRG